jgi:UDP-2,3-diacylglucosamine pyrophosphatase LpxH
MTLFISDVHLGNRACKALALVEYLIAALDAGEKELILVGDIIDDHQMSLWPVSHSWALSVILQFETVRYIPGNHDAKFRSFIGRTFRKIEVRTEYNYLASNGKRYLVTHGDLYDPWIQNTRLISLSWLVRMSRYLFESVHSWLLSDGYRKRLIKEAKDRGFAGVICGHVHEPEILKADGLDYLNCGDWVEHCTGLIDHDGEFQLTGKCPIK